MKRPRNDEDDDLDLPKGRKGRSADDDDDDDDFGGGDDNLGDDDDDLPMGSFDDDDLSDDDDEPKTAKRGKGGKGVSAEDKYADYLMYRDTGSSHDEALDLSGLSDAEFKTQSAGSRDSFDDDDDLGLDDDIDDDDDSSYTRGASRRGSYDDDDDY